MGWLDKIRIVKTQSGEKWYSDESNTIPLAIKNLEKINIIEEGGDLKKVEKEKKDKKDAEAEKREWYQTARFIEGDDILDQFGRSGKYVVETPNLKPIAIKNLEAIKKFK